MQADSKKTFTAGELAFIKDGAIFDKKEDLTRRIQGLLEDLKRALEPRLNPESFWAPEHTDFAKGQIVRGERFHRRPYVYLDLPKFFSRGAMFTYRAFFWWGWDFSFAFFLSGPYLDFYKRNLISQLNRIAGQGYYLSAAPDPWEWRKACPETIALSGEGSEKLGPIIEGMPFLKILYYVGLEDPLWVEGGMSEKGVEVFESLRFIAAR